MSRDIANQLAELIGMKDVDGHWFAFDRHPTGWKVSKGELDRPSEGFWRPDDSMFQLMFAKHRVELASGKVIETYFKSGKIGFQVHVGGDDYLAIEDTWDIGVGNELLADICVALMEWAIAEGIRKGRKP